MENMAGKTLKLKSTIILASVEEAHAVLDVEQKCYFDPNETAYFLLKLMEEGSTCQELLDNLLAEYYVRIEKATDELNCFIAELNRFNLLEITTDDLKTPIAPEIKAIKKPYESPSLMNKVEGILVSAANGPLPTITAPDF